MSYILIGKKVDRSSVFSSVSNCRLLSYSSSYSRCMLTTRFRTNSHRLSLSVRLTNRLHQATGHHKDLFQFHSSPLTLQLVHRDLQVITAMVSVCIMQALPRHLLVKHSVTACGNNVSSMSIYNKTENWILKAILV